jgi:hypothetical protein
MDAQLLLCKILTIEKLRRGKIIVDRCHICKNCGELVSHILFYIAIWPENCDW